MVDKETTKEIAKIAMLELDLKYTVEIGELKMGFADLRGEVALQRSEMPELVAREIRKCRNHRDNKKGWNLRTFLIVIGIIIPNVLAAYAVFGG